MKFITRSLVAALVIPGRVAFSYSGAIGLAILVWQHRIGLHLHWLVLPLAFIILLSMLTSDLRSIRQVGSTVCIGLLLDTLIVRSLVVPSILRIPGPWFWWPTLVRSRPIRQS
jgi:putative drug exporter of the RND superfamily